MQPIEGEIWCEISGRSTLRCVCGRIFDCFSFLVFVGVPDGVLESETGDLQENRGRFSD